MILKTITVAVLVLVIISFSTLLIYTREKYNNYVKYLKEEQDDFVVVHSSLGIIRKLYKQGLLTLKSTLVKYNIFERRNVFSYTDKSGTEYCIFPDGIICFVYLQSLIKLESFYLKGDTKRNVKRKYIQESEMLLNVILNDIHEQQKEANKKIIEAKNAYLRHFVNACGIEKEMS